MKKIKMCMFMLTIAMLIIPRTESKAAETIDSVSIWNETQYSEDLTLGVQGKFQCAAYVEYVYRNILYSHGSGLSDVNNIVTTEIIYSGEELQEYIENNACRGDAVRVSAYNGGVESQTQTHIFLLHAYDNGRITVSESNYNSINNKARMHVYEDGSTLLDECCGESEAFLVKIIHSKNNTSEPVDGILQLEMLPVSNVTASSAQINFNVVNTAKVPIEKVGAMLRLKHTDIWFPLVGEDELCGEAYSGLVYYPISKEGEIAIGLLPDTSYVYQCFVVTREGLTLYSDEYEFKTKESESPISNFKIESGLFSDVRVGFTTTHSTKKALTEAGLYIMNEQNETYKYTEHVNEKYWYWSTVNTTYRVGNFAEVDYKLEKNHEYQIIAYVIIGGREYKTNSIHWKIE